MLLKFAYFGLSVVMFLILMWIAKNTIDKTYDDSNIRKKKFRITFLSLLCWHLYLFGMASTGFVANFDFPPRFVLLMILPAFIFIGIFARKNRNSEWLQNIPTGQLIFYQSFRIAIETIFVFSIAPGIIHKNMTVEGYNYDMVFGASALVVGGLYYLKKLGDRGVLIWNFIGLGVIAIIIFLVNSTIYAPQIYGPDTLPFSTSIGLYPYALVPGFLMPSAVFIHAISIGQLTSFNRTRNKI